MKNSTKLDENTGCLNWTKGVDSRGRGHARFGGTRKKAHIFAYLLSGKKLEKGQILRHLCNNAICCNPDHLVAGTDSENGVDKAKSGVVSAENNPRALLTNKQAVAIYNLKDKDTVKNIANKFGVSVETVRYIHSGISYVFATKAQRIKGRKLGKDNNSTKLSDIEVLEIYKLKGHSKAVDLAAKYKVTKNLIYSIWKGGIRNNITGAPKNRQSRKTNIKRYCLVCNKEIVNLFGKRKHCSEDCYFLYYIDKNQENDCWIWKGNRNNNYGSMTFRLKRKIAHIFSFDKSNPELVAKRLDVKLDLVVSHKYHCNTLCCNPDHLELITRKENSEKNKQRKDISGENNSQSKLTETIAQKIIDSLVDNKSFKKIKEEIFVSFNFEVTHYQIMDIKRCKTWDYLLTPIQKEIFLKKIKEKNEKKIDLSIAKNIVEKLKKGKSNPEIIGEIKSELDLDVTYDQVHDIKRGKTWKLAWN
jgi:hypothetical protein